MIVWRSLAAVLWMVNIASSRCRFLSKYTILHLHSAAVLVRSFSSIESVAVRRRSGDRQLNSIIGHVFPNLDQTRPSFMFSTGYSAVQETEDYNQTENERKRNQTRIAILQHELNEKVQQVRTLERRVQILQDLMVMATSQPKSAVKKEINMHQQANRRLSLTVDQLKAKNFILEQQNLQINNREIYLLQQALQQKDAFLNQEREKSERNQRNLEKELYAANQEILKVESALFAMEKEFKARQGHWDRHESAMQEALEKERKHNRKIKKKLQTAQDDIDQHLEYNSCNTSTTAVFYDSDALEIAEAAIRASAQREASLSKKVKIMEHKIQQLLDESCARDQQIKEQKQELRAQEIFFFELETKHRQSEDTFQKHLDKVASTSAEELAIVQRMQQEHENMTEMWMNDKKRLLTDLESQRSKYKKLLNEEGDSFRSQINLLKSQLSDQKNNSSTEAEAFSSQNSKGLVKARVRTFFRWFSDGPRAVWKKIRNSKG